MIFSLNEGLAQAIFRSFLEVWRFEDDIKSDLNIFYEQIVIAVLFFSNFDDICYTSYSIVLQVISIPSSVNWRLFLRKCEKI